MHRATLLAIGIVLGILIIGLVVISTYGKDIHDALVNPLGSSSGSPTGAEGTGGLNGGSSGGGSGGAGGSGAGGSAGGSGGGASSGTTTPLPDDRVQCTPESQAVESCEPIDHPVCGWYDPSQVQCESESCVRSSFPNECEACMTPHIVYWTVGDCPLHG